MTAYTYSDSCIRIREEAVRELIRRDPLPEAQRVWRTLVIRRIRRRQRPPIIVPKFRRKIKQTVVQRSKTMQKK
ncbi:hypothetical protein ACHWQZ_G006226 [Mnemiopsis leidyi]